MKLEEKFVAKCTIIIIGHEDNLHFLNVYDR